MVEAAGPYPCEEYMVVLEGAADIKNAQSQNTETVVASESFVIPQGYNCQWHQNGYLKKFYVIYEDSQMQTENKNHQSIIKINDLQATENRVYYRNALGNFIVGAALYPLTDFVQQISEYHTFIYLRKGRMLIVSDDGNEHWINATEAVFIPQGTSYQWRAEEPIKQEYVKVRSV